MVYNRLNDEYMYQIKYIQSMDNDKILVLRNKLHFSRL
jgi:hypothetical protein